MAYAVHMLRETAAGLQGAENACLAHGTTDEAEVRRVGARTTPLTPPEEQPLDPVLPLAAPGSQ
jgi:hypothetical protein